MPVGTCRDRRSPQPRFRPAVPRAPPQRPGNRQPHTPQPWRSRSRRRRRTAVTGRVGRAAPCQNGGRPGTRGTLYAGSSGRRACPIPPVRRAAALDRPSAAGSLRSQRSRRQVCRRPLGSSSADHGRRGGQRNRHPRRAGDGPALPPWVMDFDDLTSGLAPFGPSAFLSRRTAG